MDLLERNKIKRSDSKENKTRSKVKMKGQTNRERNMKMMRSTTTQKEMDGAVDLLNHPGSSRNPLCFEVSQIYPKNRIIKLTTVFGKRQRRNKLKNCNGPRKLRSTQIVKGQYPSHLNNRNWEGY